MGKVMNFLKAGRHHRIEQFSVMFVALTVAILITITGCFMQSLAAQNNVLAEKAIYTPKFETSRTKVSGTVEGVYTSNDHTKSLILMKLDNMNNMSVNADNYKVFITNARVSGNGISLKSAPSGSVYLFGSSGYMGLYLVNGEGFASQVLDIVIRCNSELKAAHPSGEDNKRVQDGSFEKFDQFRVYVNPVASEAKSLSCLNNNDAPTVRDMYNQAVVVTEEAKIHDKLNVALENIRVNLNQITEYTNRLSGSDGVNVPEMPAIIKGDKIVQTKDKAGNTVLSLDAKTTVAGGWNFDWRSKSVTQGWLDGLIKSSDSPNMTYDQYFTQMARASRDSKEEINMNTEWTLTDGSLVSELDKDSAKAKNINAHIAALRGAWSQYFSNKQLYQRQLLGQLLHLEADALTIDSSASINTNADVITCY